MNKDTAIKKAIVYLDNYLRTPAPYEERAEIREVIATLQGMKAQKRLFTIEEHARGEVDYHGEGTA